MSIGKDEGLATLEVVFSEEELGAYTEFRKIGLTEKSVDWIERASATFWDATNGTINKEILDALRTFVLGKYNCECAKSKQLGFAKAFLKYLTKTRLDPRFSAFDLFLERPKTLKARKHVTPRIVTQADIENVIAYILKRAAEGRINEERAKNYVAFVLFGAYTGQRSLSTMAKLSVGQCREGIRAYPPCVLVNSSQDKIRMEHYVPLHPCLISYLSRLFDGKTDAEPLFEYNSFQMWVKRAKIPMSRFKGHFVLGDLRKFAEQYGDVIGWDQSNRAYILTHGVSGVDWSHYKHPLPEHVYDVYMRYWKNVRFTFEDVFDC